MKANEWTNKATDKLPLTVIDLAISLAPYVSSDDMALNREQFLRTVVSRIRDDLEYETW